MPANFDRCMNEGGRVITKPIDGKTYMHICIDKNGKSHPGEVKMKKMMKKGMKK